jgi:cytochrome c biogenesis protein CcdA
MRVRTIITAGLLAFAAAGVGCLVGQEAGLWPRPGARSGAEFAVRPLRPDRVVVLYLYAAQRCDTCLRTERMAEELLQRDFAEAMDSGRVEWRPLAIEVDANLRRLHEAIPGTLVVAEVSRGAGGEANFIRMDDLWKFLDDRPAFDARVGGAIRGHLPAEAPISFWWAMAVAVGLGMLTTISPCPLATNIAAMSFLGRRVGEGRAVLLPGLLYTAGQVVAFVGLGWAIAAGLSARNQVSAFLQSYVTRLLGPVLVLAGAAILGLLRPAASISLAGAKLQERARRGGAVWAAALGFLLALSFCPGTAAIFFGGLVPLALSQRSALALPLLYGLGAAVPVAGMAVAISLGPGAIGKAFGRLTQVQRWAGIVSGAVFILVGVYYSLIYIFGVSLR